MKLFDRALQPFGALSLFPSRSLLIVALFSPSSTVSLPSSYWEYSLITCASLWRTVLHDSTLLRRSLFSRFKRWTRRLFRMRIKSVQEAEPCFQVRPAGKETAEYSRSTSVGRFYLEYFGTHFYIATFRCGYGLFNKSLINEITRRRFFFFLSSLLMFAILLQKRKNLLNFLFSLDFLQKLHGTKSAWKERIKYEYFSWKEYAEELHLL